MKKIVSFFKFLGSFSAGLKKKIIRRFRIRKVRRLLAVTEKEKKECFGEIGEKLYELKRDVSFELIDVSLINGYLARLKEIDEKLVSLREEKKKLSGRGEKRTGSWWSRRGSNP